MITAACLTSMCAAADFDPFQGPKPLVIFIESDPWAMVIGADTPYVAVYENGEVVFLKKVNNRLVYHYVTLNNEDLRNIRERLQSVLALENLESRYNIRPTFTDMPEAMFYTCDGEREVATSVYGLMVPETSLPANTVFPSDLEAAVPPDELLTLHKWLCEVDYSDSKEWTPRYVEVMFWDYSYAPDASIPWPKAWHSLNSDRTIRRGDSYSIFLDGSMLPDLRKFLAMRKEKGAVEIDGKKMAIAYRLTFPSEPIWRKAFQEIAESQDRAE